MAENTAISWADHTFNPWIGCAKVSPACDGCYAEAQMGVAGRFGPARVQWGGPGQGEGTRSRTAASTWKLPHRWNRQAADAPGQTFVFCASLADVFDNAVPPEWRRDLFDLIRETPNLTWLLLTKRPGNIVKLFSESLSQADKFMLVDPPLTSLADCWPRNAAIGCTVVSQEEADRDIPKLLAAKSALNPAFAFLSMEPLLGPVYLPTACKRAGYSTEAIDWVIAGGETDQGSHRARPAHPGWFRSLRDQCAVAGVPFHFKQWGEWTPGENAGPATSAQTGAYVDDETGQAMETRFTLHALEGLHCEDEPDVWRVGKARAGRRLDGVTHDARPLIPGAALRS